MTSDYVVVPRVATEAMLRSARPMPLDHLDGIWQAMVSAAPSPWKPISEADLEDEFLVWVPDLGWRPAFYSHGQGCWCSTVNADKAYEDATHFMDFPAPPSNPT